MTEVYTNINFNFSKANARHMHKHLQSFMHTSFSVSEWPAEKFKQLAAFN